MTNYTLNIRNKNSIGDSPISLFIRWDANDLPSPLKISTGIKINPAYWQDDKSKKDYKKIVPANKADHCSLNTRLESFVLKTKLTFNKFEAENQREPTRKELILLLNPEKKEKETTLFEFIDQYIEEAPLRVDPTTHRPLSDGRIKTYKNTRETLKEHQKWADKSKSHTKTDFATINMDWYYSFIKWCLEVKKPKKGKEEKDWKVYTINNTGKYIGVLKAMLNDAKERGKNPYTYYQSKKFVTISEEVENIYLTVEELNEMAQLDLPIGGPLDKARDFFLIGAWTGLRSIDFLKLSPRHFTGNFIHTTTTKTSHDVVIPINQTVRYIYNKYDGNMPPEMSQQKINDYIKIVGMRVLLLHKNISFTITRGRKLVVETKKKYDRITTHTARRSFATNMYKLGVATKDIMAITGHKTESQFFKYVKITPQESAERMKEVMDAHMPPLQNKNS